MNSSQENEKIDYHIGIFGHYGHHNMGDEAIIQAVIQNLRSRCPSVRLSGFSMNPDDTARRYGIPAYRIRRQKSTMVVNAGHTEAALVSTEPKPLRSATSGVREHLKRFWVLRLFVRAVRLVVGLPRELWRESVFLIDSYRIARDVDSFIVAGSNQFLDNFGGVWGFPYTLLKWTVVGRCAGARVVFLSVGAGPIASMWSRNMVRISLFLADYVSFRDAGSRQLIEWAGSGGNWRVYPDLAQSLEFERRPVHDGNGLPKVGINPMPVYDRRTWYDPNDERYERYVRQLAHFTSRLLQERFPVFFFATHPSDNPVIDDVLARIDDNLIAAHGIPERKESTTVDEVMSVFVSADIVIATRYHGTVLGLRAGRPVLGICYYRKTREVLQALGQEAYGIDIDEVDHEKLWLRFGMLTSRRLVETVTIERLGEALQSRLAEQYDTVLKVLGAPTARLRLL